MKLGVWKGLATDFGMTDETIKSFLLPMARLKGPDGKPIDKNEYPSCWKEGRPYNLFKNLPSFVTGMREDGLPDTGTLKGQARVSKTFEQDILSPLPPTPDRRYITAGLIARCHGSRFPSSGSPGKAQLSQDLIGGS